MRLSTRRTHPHDGYVVLDMVKSPHKVVLDYTHTRSHLTLRATEVVNAVRTQRMGRAVFVRQRDHTWVAEVVEVALPFRRMGLATLMYDFAQQQLDGLVVRSNDTNVDSQAFWQARAAPSPQVRWRKRMRRWLEQIQRAWGPRKK